MAQTLWSSPFGFGPYPYAKTIHSRFSSISTSRSISLFYVIFKPFFADEVVHVSLLQNTKRVLSLAGNKLHFMDLKSGELLHVLPVCFPDELDDFVGPAPENLTTTQEVESLLGKAGVIKISTNEEWMVMTCTCVVYVIDLMKMEVRTHLQGHADVVTCLALSEGGKLVVTGSFDKTVRVSLHIINSLINTLFRI